MFGPPMLLDMSKAGLVLDVAHANPTGLSCKSPRQELMPNQCPIVLGEICGTQHSSSSMFVLALFI